MSYYLLWLEMKRIENKERIRRKRERARRQSVLRKRELFDKLPDPFMEMAEDDFMATYRLSVPVAQDLVEELKPYLSDREKKRRVGDITIQNMVLTTLAFYASGTYKRGVGLNFAHSSSQPSVSTVIREVTRALNHSKIQQKYLKFPLTADDRKKLKKKFHDAFGIPDVIGCIGSTHVAVMEPKVDPWLYFNEKTYSIKTSIMCDSDLNIMYARYNIGLFLCRDGDAWEWNQANRHFKSLWENKIDTAYVLGDSQYFQRPWLMTPILDPAPGSPEENYVNKHARAREVVDKSFKALKGRWKCLEGVLNYEPRIATEIINACVILHNIANAHDLPVDIYNPELDSDDDMWSEGNGDYVKPVPPEEIAGLAERQVLVERLSRDLSAKDPTLSAEVVDVTISPELAERQVLVERLSRDLNAKDPTSDEGMEVAKTVAETEVIDITISPELAERQVLVERLSRDLSAKDPTSDEGMEVVKTVAETEMFDITILPEFADRQVLVERLSRDLSAKDPTADESMDVVKTVAET